MQRFSLWTVLVVFALVALLLALTTTRKQLAEANRQLATFRNEMRYLTIEDSNNIHAISMPAFESKQWRWRIDLPDDTRYQMRIAYDDIPHDGMAPKRVQDIYAGALPSQEFIFTANISKDEDGWIMSWATESDASRMQTFDFPILATNKTWLDNMGLCSLELAGQRSTATGDPMEPFFLLRMRTQLPAGPNLLTADPNPTDGILIWIEPINDNGR